MMKINLLNKTIIVTGGTRGIGSAIVDLLQECNAEVIATGTDHKEIDTLNHESTNKKINYVQLDFTSNQSIKSFIHNFIEGHQIDVLINNAGVNKIESIDNIDEDEWDWINNVNIRGPFLLTRSIANKMKVQGHGSIINISSVFGVVSKTKRAAYSTTKWGLVGFTKAVALDLAPYNILVNAVSPGFINTELTRKILGDKGINDIKGKIPQQRLAEAREIAKTVAFLVSDHNTYITGQNIIVDGGFTSA